MLTRAAKRKANPRTATCTYGWSCVRCRWLSLVSANTSIGHVRPQRTALISASAGQSKVWKDANISTPSSSRQYLATTLVHQPPVEIPLEGLLPTRIEKSPLRRNRAPINLGIQNFPPENIRRSPDGVMGDLHEILSVLDACLQVGKIERAEVIIKRIGKIGVLDPASMLDWHNRYLRACVERMLTAPTKAAIEILHKWFELEIRQKYLDPNEYTAAYMLKATLQLTTLKEKRKFVERYCEFVPVESDAPMTNVLSLGIFSRDELMTIQNICPSPVLAKELEVDMPGEEYAEPELPLLQQEDQSTELPHVRSKSQKGMGLKTLQKSLALLTQRPTAAPEVAMLSKAEQRALQASLEEDAVSSAVDRWRQENSDLRKMGLDTNLQTKSLGARMWLWQELLEKAIEEECKLVDKAEAEVRKGSELATVDRLQYGPFLKRLKPEKMAAVTIISLMSLLGQMGIDQGCLLVRIILKVAQSVEDECTMEALQRERKKKFHKFDKITDRARKNQAMQRMASTLNKDATHGLLELPIQAQRWPTSIKTKLGAFLVSALLDTAKFPVTLEHPESKELVTQIQPAFFHTYHFRNGKKLGALQPNKALIRQMKQEPVHSVLAKQLPMIIPPDPWTGFSKGGYISHPGKMMRIKLNDKEQQLYAEAAVARGDMDLMFRGLDVLGKTGWRINHALMDVMLQAWNSGEAIAKIPAENPEFEIPPEPPASGNPSERRLWLTVIKRIENERGGLHSQRCYQNFQLEIGRALANEEFYFPHNVDFRGRAYPIPAYLNHMGADACRALLIFGKGKELGENGLRWLKVHLANVYGYDKASFKEREAFAVDNLDRIIESATNPLGEKRWWLQAEDPWQCLASCIELRNALNSPDPARFISHLPIHQDGTCNGLQHYAALGGDVWGARQVNLEPSDRPADVYTAVAELVKESVNEEAKENHVLAKLLEGKVTRKVVKQTVMTNVYGVTFMGAKEQIKRQLIAAYPDLPNEQHINPDVLARYVARKVFNALSTMFRGAHDIQYWLGKCASRICQSVTPEQLNRAEAQWIDPLPAKLKLEDVCAFKSTVIWTTPLNMPVVQPYRTPKSRMITTSMQNITIQEPRRSDTITLRKQLQAFPPNFIHSLDATHMVLSALECDSRNLTFAAVHDSFWTHAADLDTMNNLLRDTFVRLHSEDVIGRLAAEFAARYKGSMYLARVDLRTPVGKEVVRARSSLAYCNRLRKFRKSRARLKAEELVIEFRRLKLLASDDPKEVEEGQKMVTPASVVQTMAGKVETVTRDEVKDVIGIGELQAGVVADDQVLDHHEQSGDDLAVAVDEEMEHSDLREDEAEHEVTEIEKDMPEDTEQEGSTYERSFFKRKSKPVYHTYVWLPWALPPVPQKVKCPKSSVILMYSYSTGRLRR